MLSVPLTDTFVYRFSRLISKSGIETTLLYQTINNHSHAVLRSCECVKIELLQWEVHIFRVITVQTGNDLTYLVSCYGHLLECAMHEIE